MKANIKHILCAVLLTTLLGACDDEQDSNTPDTAVIGQPAPEIAALDEHGELVKLPTDGDKPVLLNFWTTGCGICIVELHGFSDYLEQHPDAFTLVPINITRDGDLKQLAPYMRSKGITTELYIDQFDITRERYDVVGSPYSYLISADGIVRAKHMGLLEPEALPKWLSADNVTDSTTTNAPQKDNRG